MAYLQYAYHLPLNSDFDDAVQGVGEHMHGGCGFGFRDGVMRVENVADAIVAMNALATQHGVKFDFCCELDAEHVEGGE